MHDVEGVIAEMLRVGRTCIVSFPNFAYHQLRRMLAEEGRAPEIRAACCATNGTTPPTSGSSPSPTLKISAARKNIRVHRRIALDTEAGAEVFEDPNLNADLAIFVISRA